MIHYHHTTENLSWENLSTLFESVGWGPRSASELHAAFLRPSTPRQHSRDHAKIFQVR